MKWRSLTTAMFLVFVGSPLLARADVITSWNDTAGRAARLCNANPLHESRMYAMAHLAIHDALNAIDRRFQPYAFDSQRAGGSVCRGGRGGRGA